MVEEANLGKFLDTQTATQETGHPNLDPSVFRKMGMENTLRFYATLRQAAKIEGIVDDRNYLKAIELIKEKSNEELAPVVEFLNTLSKDDLGNGLYIKPDDLAAFQTAATKASFEARPKVTTAIKPPANAQTGVFSEEEVTFLKDFEKATNVKIGAGNRLADLNTAYVAAKKEYFDYLKKPESEQDSKVRMDLTEKVINEREIGINAATPEQRADFEAAEAARLEITKKLGAEKLSALILKTNGNKDLLPGMANSPDIYHSALEDTAKILKANAKPEKPLEVRPAAPVMHAIGDKTVTVLSAEHDSKSLSEMDPKERKVTQSFNVVASKLTSTDVANIASNRADFTSLTTITAKPEQYNAAAISQLVKDGRDIVVTADNKEFYTYSSKEKSWKNTTAGIKPANVEADKLPAEIQPVNTLIASSPASAAVTAPKADFVGYLGKSSTANEIFSCDGHDIKTLARVDESITKVARHVRIDGSSLTSADAEQIVSDRKLFPKFATIIATPQQLSQKAVKDIMNNNHDIVVASNDKFYQYNNQSKSWTCFDMRVAGNIHAAPLPVKTQELPAEVQGVDNLITAAIVPVAKEVPKEKPTPAETKPAPDAPAPKTTTPPQLLPPALDAKPQPETTAPADTQQQQKQSKSVAPAPNGSGLQRADGKLDITAFNSKKSQMVDAASKALLAADFNKDGYITSAEAHQAIQNYTEKSGQFFPEKQFGQLMASRDNRPLSKDELRQKIGEAFDKFGTAATAADHNKDGGVDRNEMREVMNVPAGNQPSGNNGRNQQPNNSKPPSVASEIERIAARADGLGIFNRRNGIVTPDELSRLSGGEKQFLQSHGVDLNRTYVDKGNPAAVAEAQRRGIPGYAAAPAAEHGNNHNIPSQQQASSAAILAHAQEMVHGTAVELRHNTFNRTIDAGTIGDFVRHNNGAELAGMLGRANLPINGKINSRDLENNVDSKLPELLAKAKGNEAKFEHLVKEEIAKELKREMNDSAGISPQQAAATQSPHGKTHNK